MHSSSSFRPTANPSTCGHPRAADQFCTSLCIPPSRRLMLAGQGAQTRGGRGGRRPGRVHRRWRWTRCGGRRPRAVLMQPAAAARALSLPHVPMQGRRLAAVTDRTARTALQQPLPTPKQPPQCPRRAAHTQTLARKDWRRGERCASIRPPCRRMNKCVTMQ